MKYRYIKMFALLAMLMVGVSPGAVSAQEQTFASIEKERGFPVRGQTRATVREMFGEPGSSKQAVGRPPISSWKYSEFTVYFENDLVITAVAENDKLPLTLGDIQ